MEINSTLMKFTGVGNLGGIVRTEKIQRDLGRLEMWTGNKTWKNANKYIWGEKKYETDIQGEGESWKAVILEETWRMEYQTRQWTRN